MSTHTTPRSHPTIGAIFKAAEARHFTDAELQSVGEAFPEKAPEIEAIKAIRESDVAIINAVVKTIFSMYDYDAKHDFASAKCPRDVRYVVQYACAAMLAGEPQWLQDKLLIWLKTILQAFEFPARKPETIPAEADALESTLAKLPQKSQSIYHCYYLLREGMQRGIPAPHYQRIEPFLTASLETLTEAY